MRVGTCFALVAWMSMGIFAHGEDASRPPNIVFILADDQDYHRYPPA